MIDKKEFQDSQYNFPYHHIVNLLEYNNIKIFHWGLEYYCYINRIISLVRKLNPNTLLDVGCGDGAFDLALSKIQPSINITACDLSEKAINLARSIGYDSKINFQVININEVVGEYDTITCIETLEHIPDDEIQYFIAELVKKIKVGGHLIISVPTINRPLHVKHYRHYDSLLLEQTVKAHPLKTIKHLPTYKISTFGILLQKISNKFGTFNFIQKMCHALAKKHLFAATEKNAAHIIGIYQKI